MRRYFFGLAMMALAMMAPAIARADDSQIARQIIERLQVEKRAGNLKGFNIDLQVDEGTVWMSGKLASEQQRAKALDIARRIPGVKQVVNDLKVAGEETKRPIRSEMADDSVPTDDADVASKSGVSGLLNGLKPAYWSRRDKAEESTDASEVKPASATAVGTGVTPGAVQAAPAPYYAPTARPAPQATPVSSGPAQIGQTTPRDPVAVSRAGSPLPMGAAGLRQTQYEGQIIQEGGGVGPNGEPCPMYGAPGVGAMRYDHPNMPGYSWPSYAAYPNYAAVTYPKQYSPTVWPYIGPFYPYPQVPMGWRKVTLEWDDGWWFLDFKDSRKVCHGRW
jgi:hypothetical protein